MRARARKSGLCKACIPTKVEHPLHVIKRQFVLMKARLRSLAKGAAHVATLLALSSLGTVRKHLITTPTVARPKKRMSAVKGAEVTRGSAATCHFAASRPRGGLLIEAGSRSGPVQTCLRPYDFRVGSPGEQA